MEADSLPFYFPNSYSMNRLKKSLKPISLLLAFVVLLQGCTVYKLTSITLEQAVQKKSKTKVEWNNGFTSKYKKIVFENGNYYGVIKNDGQIQKSPLDEKNIAKILPKDQLLSPVLNSPLYILAGGFLVYAFAYIRSSNK